MGGWGSKYTNRMLADVVLIVHAMFVLFVVGGLLATWIGVALDRPFARNRAFRAAHLAAIAFVVVETLLGYACPLTVWEDALRGHRAEGGFIERFVHAWMFWDAPPWVFQAAYVAFGVAVGLTWWRWPPRKA